MATRASTCQRRWDCDTRESSLASMTKIDICVKWILAHFGEFGKFGESRLGKCWDLPDSPTFAKGHFWEDLPDTPTFAKGHFWEDLPDTPTFDKGHFWKKCDSPLQNCMSNESIPKSGKWRASGHCLLFFNLMFETSKLLKNNNVRLA